jgi:Xaa-Pro aminopeptidase
MRDHQYDALAFTAPDWFEWLSNYGITDQSFERPYVLLVTADGRSFAVASDLGRYGMAIAARRGQLWLDSLVNYSESPAKMQHKWIATQWQELMVETLRAAGLERGRIATESSGSLLAPAAAAFPELRIEQPHPDLRNVRRIKHGEEIATMRRCASVADWAIGAYREELRPERLLTEVDYVVSARLAAEAARRLPGEGFMIRGLRTVAGPASICSDGFRPDDQLLKANDGIVSTSIATRLNGLAMELARPWLIGKANERIQGLFDCLQEAHLASMEAATAGRPISGIHAAAQEVFERAGNGAHFILRAGHGIGVIQHDFPVNVPFDGRALLENETYALEPSLYVEELGVFRFADTIAVTASGPNALTRATRDRAGLTLS